MTSKVLAIFAGLLFAGTIPASAPVTATIFSLAAVVALFDGDPTRILRLVTRTADRVARAVESTVNEVVDEAS